MYSDAIAALHMSLPGTFGMSGEVRVSAACGGRPDLPHTGVRAANRVDRDGTLLTFAVG